MSPIKKFRKSFSGSFISKTPKSRETLTTLPEIQDSFETVVFDIGTYCCKLGLHTHERPSYIFPTVVGASKKILTANRTNDLEFKYGVDAYKNI
jgi:actin-related protein